MSVLARDLTVSRGGEPVLRAVDLELGDGEVVAVVGPNGAGKSTLLALIAGLLSPDSGTVEMAGRCVLALQTPALARRSALANVESALRWWGVARGDRRQRAQHALDQLGVADLAGRRADTLSGGEARRVHLARAFAVEADVLLLDEPFAGLDPGARANLLGDVGATTQASRSATAIVVHDLGEALALGDRMAVMLDGRLAAMGPPRELFAAPPTREVARFFGYRGELAEPGGAVRMLRPADVELTADGDIEGRVARVVPIEDGVRVELETAAGPLAALTGLPGPTVGESVRLRARGGVRFPA